MRISVGDVDAHRAQIFFNGAPINNCTMADEERGEVIVFATNRAGSLLINKATGDAMSFNAHGSVSVFIPARRPEGGFDAWMRERTDAAHQAMMKHARRGGILHT